MPWVGWPPAETGRDRLLAEAGCLQQFEIGVRVRVGVRVRARARVRGRGRVRARAAAPPLRALVIVIKLVDLADLVLRDEAPSRLVRRALGGEEMSAWYSRHGDQRRVSTYMALLTMACLAVAGRRLREGAVVALALASLAAPPRRRLRPALVLPDPRLVGLALGAAASTVQAAAKVDLRREHLVKGRGRVGVRVRVKVGVWVGMIGVGLGVGVSGQWEGLGLGLGQHLRRPAARGAGERVAPGHHLVRPVGTWLIAHRVRRAVLLPKGRSAALRRVRVRVGVGVRVRVTGKGQLGVKVSAQGQYSGEG